MIPQVSFLTSPLVYKTAALALVVASIAVASIAGYSRVRGELGTPSTHSTIPLPQRSRPNEGVETELVTIRPSGFEPSQITRPKGPFVLAIANRSGVDGVAISLERVAGNRIRDANVSRTKPNWREVVDLQPGRYILTEANHSEWKCEITIAEK